MVFYGPADGFEGCARDAAQGHEAVVVGIPIGVPAAVQKERNVRSEFERYRIQSGRHLCDVLKGYAARMHGLADVRH